ncbi:MAG: enoyl-CoA hydratase [Gammaproteobacteria bacterium]|nr:enoyl-CoA hydratase [Gammaproteobacteria bacterium]
MGLITLNRQEKLNALNDEMIHALINAAIDMDKDPEIGCIVLTGSERVFAAGADIAQLAEKSFLDLYNEDYFSIWEKFTRLRTPKIAAVAGYALGGGCELAMMCDLIYAAENAQFGQPEIKLGVIPGMGGTQRLTRLIGQNKAMDMILTGRMMDAVEAERCGLVARVFSTDQFLGKAIDNARTIAQYSETARIAARETVEHAIELNLREGILFERRIYHSLWNTPDQREGMAAFLEKRQAVF